MLMCSSFINRKKSGTGLSCSLVFFFLGLLSCSLWAANDHARHPFYVGGIAGSGSTTWYGLVPTGTNADVQSILRLSTPIETKEGGGVFGALFGYEFTPFFAAEFNYLKYPNAYVMFDTISTFYYDYDESTYFKSNTETVGLLGKIMMLIPNTSLKLYSGAGIAGLHRRDIITDEWLVTPTFNIGLIAPMGERFTAEIVGNYTAGYGEPEVRPADVYFPFLYSLTARLAYHF